MRNPFQKVMRLLDTLLENDAQEPPSLSSSHQRNIDQLLQSYSLPQLLPYESYDKKSEVFINRNSVGFVLWVTPLTHASQHVAQTFNGIFADILPAHVDVQLTLWGSDKIGALLDPWVARRSQSSLLTQISQTRRDYFAKGAYESLTGRLPNLLRNFQCWLSVSVEKQVVDNQIAQLAGLREQMISVLQTTGVHVENVSIDGFLSLLKTFLYPHKNPNYLPVTHQPHTALSQQLSAPEFAYRLSPECLRVIHDQETVCLRSLAVDQYPTEGWAIWGMGNLIGDLFNAAQQMPCPFAFSFSARILDHPHGLSRAQIKSVRTEQMANSVVGKFVASLKHIHRDWEFVKDRLHANDRLMDTHFQVTLFNYDDDGSANESKVKGLFRAKGWRLNQETFLQFPCFLSSLPMQLSEGYYRDFKKMQRFVTMPSLSAAQLLPITGEWKGTNTPGLLLSGRRGQVMWWDNYANKGDHAQNYNVCVAASPGSGKSVMINEKVASEIASGGWVRVIDHGRSFEKTCKLLGGQFVEFTQKDKQPNFNPFTHIYGHTSDDIKEALELIKPLIAMMARPKTQTSEEEDRFIEQAVIDAWEAKKHAATITTVCECLKKYRQGVADNLAHLLGSYAKGGMYDRYFEGSSNINFNNPFLVLEIDGISEKMDLQKVILMALMQSITESMFLSDRDQRKSVIIDEAWELLKGNNKNAHTFIERLCRRARKHEGCVIIITQGVDDFLNNAATRAAWDYSSWKLFLAQEESAINSLKKNQEVDVDVFRERLLKDVHTTEFYSEVVIWSAQGCAIGRLYLDPFSLTLFSTKGQQYAAVKRLIEQGVSLVDAVKEVAAHA